MNAWRFSLLMLCDVEKPGGTPARITQRTKSWNRPTGSCVENVGFQLVTLADEFDCHVSKLFKDCD